SKCKASLEIVKHPRELNSKMHARYMEASKEHNNAEQQLRNAEQDCRKKPQAERDACIKPHQAKRDSAYAQMQRFKKLWDEASEKSGKAEKEAGALQQQCKAEQNTAQDKYREKYKSCIK
ncbi:MAG TPA: hypothetical protein PKW28_13955, partial [Turneriella sp.]|nr:hypothetical protein [Turneriella sp.]